MTFLTGSYVARWRKMRDIPRREMGVAMGYRGREYIKKIELGYMPITGKFANRFASYKNHVQAKERRQIKSRYPLPPKLKILARPRKCVVCKEWFVFPNESDRVCTARECRKHHDLRRANQWCKK